MNENEEILEEIITVSENSAEVPVDAHIGTLTVIMENETDNSSTVSLLEDIKADLENIDNVLVTLSQNSLMAMQEDDIEVEVVESNSIITKPLQQYTVTESLLTVLFVGCLVFAAFKLFFKERIR